MIVNKDRHYKHNCDNCIYLGKVKRYVKPEDYNINIHTKYGRALWKEKNLKDYVYYDLYYCELEPTLVIRYSDKPEGYISGLISARQILIDKIKNKPINTPFIFEDDPLLAALYLAIKHGFLELDVIMNILDIPKE